MESKQLVDALTDHIAFYHSSSSSSFSNPNPNPRNPILRWFSSLSPADRQQTLTLIDPKFVRVLLQMRSRLDCNGRGSFFLLPDLPSSSDPSLPSLCFRRSRGLLARAGNPRDLLVSESLLLFGSRKDEELDSVTVDEAFVSDVDRFMEVMDGVSNGRFLRGEEKGLELEKEWAEMEWLKDKGYYSLEVFSANRLEVALRLAWRASGRGGRKGKGGGSGNGVAAAAAASALWRKKGCVDWWAGLDLKQREQICMGFLGKTAKCLANDIVKAPNIALRNRFSFLNNDSYMPLKFGPNASGQTSEMFLRRDSDFCLDLTPSSGMPHYFAKLLNKLLIVQEISAILLACQLNKVEKETLFFSRLGAALTVADLIMRKLRGIIMVVSIEHINQELMGGEKLKTLPKKAEDKKINVSYRKGKKPRNSKRLNSLPKPSKVNSTWQAPSMNSERRSDHLKDRSLCHQVDTLSLTDSQKKGIFNDSVLPKDRGKGHAVDLLDYKGHADKKRNEGKRAKPKKLSSKEVVIPNKNKKIIIPSVSAETKKAECVVLADTLMARPISSDLAVEDGLLPILGCCNVSEEVVDNIEKMNDSTQVDYPPCFADKCSNGKDCSPVSNELENGVINHVVPCVANDERNKQTISSCPSVTSSTVFIDKQIDITCSRSTPCCDNTGLPLPTWEIESADVQNENEHPIFTGQRTLLSILPEPTHAPVKENTAGILSDHSGRYIYNHLSPMGGMSYEWPNITPSTLTSVSSLHRPATTDRLHLEVGHKCQNHFHQSLPSRHQARNSSVEGGQSRILPSLIPMSYDWPPMVKTCSRLSQTATVSYDSAFNPPFHPSFCSGFAAHAGHGAQVNGAASESNKKETGDPFDLYDMKGASELVDDPESYWLSEEETETHAVFGRDYNQFFGGGVMYWNPAEHVAGFSRPPSHSSEDSSWAWYEADLNRAIDDMVGMPGLPTPYNTTGLASPPSASFCSPFDPLGSGQQQIGYALPGNDSGNVLHSSSTSDVPEENASISLNNSPGGVEGAKGDLLPYARLRPIIAPSVSRNGSRSEFKLAHGHKSPCLPSTRRDHPRIKRPPSPVVLCVPRVPRPPPPSPVGESRKRGFPIVRSGSSSPRHWGMRSRANEDGNCEDPRLCLEGVEVVWPSWGAKGLVGTTVAQSVQGSLLQDHLITISQLTRDQEHPDIALPVQPPDILNSPHKASLSLMHNLLHEEIDFFCKQVAAENLIRKPYINWAIKRVARSLQVLWPRSRTNIFGSNATGLALPTSDVDLVVSLPPVRNLEPIKEAGILEGRNGIKETCLQHAARYLANQEWVRNDSLKSVENTAIPVIMLVAEVPHDIICPNGASSIAEIPEVRPTLIPTADASSHPSTDHASLPICSKNVKDVASSVTSIRLDISFKSTSHTGLQTSELVRELTQQFPASVPLALVLKIFLADRSLDHAYSGGLSSYCLVLLIIRFLQHEHHMGRPINHNLGSLLMDFLYFFGNVFDPRQMRISIQGSGVYVKRERGLSIDPIHIDDPLFPCNNVGRNCFRIHQCIKAFADAYSQLENELQYFSGNYTPNSNAEFTLLRKIIPSIYRG